MLTADSRGYNFTLLCIFMCFLFCFVPVKPSCKSMMFVPLLKQHYVTILPQDNSFKLFLMVHWLLTGRCLRMFVRGYRGGRWRRIGREEESDRAWCKRQESFRLACHTHWAGLQDVLLMVKLSFCWFLIVNNITKTRSHVCLRLLQQVDDKLLRKIAWILMEKSGAMRVLVKGTVEYWWRYAL